MNWEYLTGFFDGEGNIGLMQRREKTSIESYIKIINSNKTVLEEIVAFLGFGKIHVNNKKGSNLEHPQWNTTYSIQIGNRENILLFIEGCLPYVIVKKKQMLLMEEFLKLRQKHRSRKGRKKEETTFTDREYEIYREMFSLNMQRGIKRLGPNYPKSLFPKNLINKEILVNLYIEQNRSQEEISKILNVSRESVKTYLKKYEIPKRSLSDSAILNWRNRGNRNSKSL